VGILKATLGIPITTLSEVGILKTTLGIPITTLSEVGILKTTASNFSTFRYIFHACNFFQQLLGQNY
jgi:hypothetical protein